MLFISYTDNMYVFPWIFTIDFIILKVFLFVHHQFKISDLIPFYHFRILSAHVATDHKLLASELCQVSSGDDNDTHKYNYKLLKKLNVTTTKEVATITKKEARITNLFWAEAYPG